MDGSYYFPITGVSYVAKLETEYMLSQNLAVCNNCLALGSKTPLRRCVGCQLAAYCSKDCQKRHWPRHRTFCNMVQAKGKKNAYLSGFEQEKCFEILIDSYRLRTANDHFHREENHGIYYSGKGLDGLVWAKGDTYADFQRYLDLAEDEQILPIWWTFETRMECLAIAVDKSNQEGVFTVLDQEQLLIRYGGDTTIRNALCILAELVVGHEGRGAPVDENWFQDFRELLDRHPEERARLISGTVKAVETAPIAQEVDPGI